MASITTHPSRPGVCIVRVSQNGQRLRVCIPFKTVQQTLGADETFQGICNAVTAHLDRISEIAWEQFSRTRLTTVSLTSEDFEPKALTSSAATRTLDGQVQNSAPARFGAFLHGRPNEVSRDAAGERNGCVPV